MLKRVIASFSLLLSLAVSSTVYSQGAGSGVDPAPMWPAGSNNDIQYYNNGWLGAESALTYDPATNKLTVTGTGSSSGLVVTGYSSGANDEPDAEFGNANYGSIRVGNNSMMSSSYSASNLDLDQALIFRNDGSLGTENDPGIAFGFLEGGNDLRFAIPTSGADKGIAFIRSAIIAGPFNVTTGNDTVLCSTWTAYDSNIDCNTSSTGADLFVQDDLEVEGTIFAHESIQLEGATADGFAIILNPATDPTQDYTINIPAVSGTMALTTNSLGTIPFTDNNTVDYQTTTAASLLLGVSTELTNAGRLQIKGNEIAEPLINLELPASVTANEHMFALQTVSGATVLSYIDAEGDAFFETVTTDDNTAVAGGNFLQIFDNDSGNSSAGSSGTLRILDSDTSATDAYSFLAGTLNMISLNESTGVFVNDAGVATIDFTVESDDEPRMLFVDASLNRVNIGEDNTSHNSMVTVSGRTSQPVLTLAPAATANEVANIQSLNTAGTATFTVDEDGDVVANSLEVNGKNIVGVQEKCHFISSVENSESDLMGFAPTQNIEITAAYCYCKGTCTSSSIQLGQMADTGTSSTSIGTSFNCGKFGNATGQTTRSISNVQVAAKDVVVFDPSISPDGGDIMVCVEYEVQ